MLMKKNEISKLKSNNFIMQHIFKKGLVWAFLFGILITMSIIFGVGFDKVEADALLASDTEEPVAKKLIYKGNEAAPTGFMNESGQVATEAELEALGISADISTNTITMNGFNLYSSKKDPLEIKGDVTIELVGTNRLESTLGTAIWANASVTFTGSGSLNAIGRVDTWARGIAVDNTLTFNHTGTIIAHGDREGIRTPEESRDIVVNSGKVITTGYRGTSCRNLIINGGDVEAYGIDGRSSEALYANNKIEINDGRVYAKVDSYGINCGNLDISGGIVEIYTQNKSNAKGINVWGTSADISGGDITINMNTDADNKDYRTDCISVSGATLNITGGIININNGASGNGINSNANINIGSPTDSNDNTVINITKGKDYDGNGIYTTSDLNVYEGDITIGEIGESNFHYGIDLNGTFNMYNGEITSYGYTYGIDTTHMNMYGGEVYAQTTVAKNIAEDKRAIYIYNSFSMSGGHVEAKLIGSHGVGLWVEGSTGSTRITGGYMEIEVSGKYTKGLRIKSELIIGTVGTEGPTIIITGDIQNEKQATVYYDESGIFVENNLVINSGNIKIDMKNTAATYVGESDNPANNYIAAIMSTVDKNEAAGITVNGGNIDLNVDVRQPDGSYSGGDGMFTYGFITINGGRIISKTNGGVYWVNGILYHSAGIDAKKDLTITGGEIQAINTNVNNAYDQGTTSTLIGRGLYSDEDIIVSGGHILAQGINQAIAGANTSISTSTNLSDGELSILASQNYNGNPLVTYIPAENSTYKYVEIGVLHTYYLRYDKTDKKIYKGNKVNDTNVTLGNDIDDDTTNDSEDVLADLGIYVSSSTGIITLDTAIFASSAEYGLYIEGSATIYLTENTVSRISANKDGAEESRNEIGIYCEETLTISGPGQLIASGCTSGIQAGTAINLTTAAGNVDYDKIALYGSKDYTYETDIIHYPDVSTLSEWNKYKYMCIGSLPAYYFRYNVSEGQMYKVVGNTQTPITKNQVIYGWSIVNNILKLDGFKFATSAASALEIVSNDPSDVAQIYVEDTCEITTLHDKYDTYNGVKCDVELNMTGAGTLNISREYKDSEVAVVNTLDEYTGLYVGGDLTITSGTYNITGEKYGIYVADNKKLTINNAIITSKATSTSETSGAIYIAGTTPSSDVYAKVQVADNALGNDVSTVTDYDSNIEVYNTKKYIKIEPAIVSVTVTWGDMEYVVARVWEPNNHTYNNVIEGANEDSGLVRVHNDESRGSNIPVKATIEVVMSNSYGITGQLISGMNLRYGVIGLNETLEDDVKINATQLVEEITDATVGSVSVILGDYRK